MIDWVDVTDTFSEKERHYKNVYLEVCEEAYDKIEISVFSSISDPYEIYFTYGKMYGIVYTDAKNAYKLRDAMKKDIEEEFSKNGFEPSSEFVNSFCEKYEVCLPGDIFFDSEKFMNSMINLFDSLGSSDPFQ